MFDFHLHSCVSFDSDCNPQEIITAAQKRGLKEICFTDHYDFNDDINKPHDLFEIDDYKAAYDRLESDSVIIRRGVEFGLTHWNCRQLKDLLSSYDFDFCIGSVHYAGGYDPYCKEYWEYNGWDEGFEKYLLQTLNCVKAHKDFDVLGHINYICKSVYNPTKKPLYYKAYSDICDEIMKELAYKGKGMEINTSGFDRVGEFLPDITYIKRFKELGGEIITVGSDSHNGERVGQYIDSALEIAKEIFGYVCIFEKRKVKFNRL